MSRGRARAVVGRSRARPNPHPPTGRNGAWSQCRQAGPTSASCRTWTIVPAVAGRPLPAERRRDPLANVQALRRRGVDAKLVVFERSDAPGGRRRLDRAGRPARRQARPVARASPACSRGPTSSTSTSGSRSAEVPPVPAPARCSGRSPSTTSSARTSAARPPPSSPTARADAQIVGSYDAIRWVPDAEVVPPGIDLRGSSRPRRRPRAARSSSTHRRAARARAPSTSSRPARSSTSTSRSSRASTTTRPPALRARRHRRRPAERRLVRAVRDRGDGARQARRDLAPRGGGRGAPRRPSASRCRSSRPRRRRSSSGCRPLVESPEERRRIGAASRAYVERVHDADRIADRLIEIYARVSSEASSRPRLARAVTLPMLRPDQAARPHSAIYGLGGLVSRILSVLLLPLYTRYLSHGRLRRDRDARRARRGSRRSSSASGSRARSSASTSTRPTTRGGRVVVRTSLLVHDGERDRWASSPASSFAAPISHALQLGDDATASSAPPPSGSGRR